jgi:CspA family cold shock protein
MRKTGRVKWYSEEKGFGFLVIEGLGDVLVHRTVLHAAGIASIKEGAIVDCDVVQRLKGAQVSVVHSVDESGVQPALSSSGLPRPMRGRALVLDEPTGPALVAEVKWFSRPKGYGFVVTGDGEEDAFLHTDVLRKSGLSELKLGQRLLVRIVRGPKGRTVVEAHDLPDKIPAGARRDKAGVLESPGRTRTGVLGQLLMIDAVRGFGVVSLPDMDDVAFASIELLRAVGATDPRTCGLLICDVEFAPALIVVCHISRPH